MIANILIATLRVTYDVSPETGDDYLQRVADAADEYLDTLRHSMLEHLRDTFNDQHIDVETST